MPCRRPSTSHRILLFILLVALGASAHLHAQSSVFFRPFRDGEHLVYKVKWSFIRLGSVSLVQEPTPGPLSASRIHVDGESAAGLPFIDVLFRSSSLLDHQNPVNQFYELESGRGLHTRTVYIADSSDRVMYAIETKAGQTTRSDTIAVSGPYYDGTGLMMYARLHAGSDTTVVLPTIMEHRMGSTTIVFSSKTEALEVAGIDGPIRAYPFHGTTDWKGTAFAGMSGDFRGWVSDEPRRLILRAEVKIFLGSAVLELEKIVR